MRNEQTLAGEIIFEGQGVFTGQRAVVKLKPMGVGFGIQFKRTDLTGQPAIKAEIEFAQESPRSTSLAKEGASVQTVEHLLSALKGCGIDHLLIEISGPEVPIFDGSAKPFVDLIETVGIKDLGVPLEILRLEQPVFMSRGDLHMVALPSDEFRVSYTLHYPNSPYLQSQYFSLAITRDAYKSEIAPCRTFVLYEEIAPLIEKGLLKSAGLDNGVVIQGDAILNPEGVRFRNEMVRHKILDLVGDISLAGHFSAHIIAIKTGHRDNCSFARELKKHLRRLDHVGV